MGQIDDIARRRNAHIRAQQLLRARLTLAARDLETIVALYRSGKCQEKDFLARLDLLAHGMKA